MEPKQIDLYEFLVESELQQYYNSIKNELKITNSSHLKYATDEDLKQIGLSRPEIRRLRKFYEKYYPHGYFSKIKRLLQPPRKDDGGIHSSEQPFSEPTTKTLKSPSKVPSNKHIIPADAICVNKQLGTGEFGIVQQGVWTNGIERIQVAIKCLCRERMQSNPMEFLKEAAIMHANEHENIVRLYGVVLDTDSLMLVTELAHLRSLLECLKDSGLRVSFLTVPTLCEFAMQICNGMMYLESKRLIHRDLAARNILVFSKNKVKISDFGLSRALGVGKDYYKTNFNVNLKLPIAWCAPECINYLRFTNSSDVWAYGVCLWEMFSYGFQPWAALTGLQILEAIDEPNYQRLEQPECCPRDYYNLMLKCWQHDPYKRPTFNEIFYILPDLKPEQLKTVVNNCESKKDNLLYRQGEIITVLDKNTNSSFWKGVLNSGKTGLFNPVNTVAYLEGLPCSGNRDSFNRNFERSSKRKIRSEMISMPQNDLKHTGHVGLDGAYFGDVAFLGSSQNYNRLPRQIVTPYKPSEDIEQTPLLLPPTPTSPDSLQTASGYFPEELPTSSINPTFINSNENTPVHQSNFGSSFKFPPKPQVFNSSNPFATENPDNSILHNNNYAIQSNNFTNSNMEDGNLSTIITTHKINSNTSTTSGNVTEFQHEYHEISDDEITADTVFDLGPSLLDEINSMFGSINNSNNETGIISKSPNFDHTNKKNVLTELSSNLIRKNNNNDSNGNKCKKKTSGIVKQISVKDEKILNHAIEIANEISARSMTDLVSDHPQTSQSPKRKFSFRFPHLSHHTFSEKDSSSIGYYNGNSENVSHSKERKNFSEELKSIPDLQNTITEEGREAYNSLIEKKSKTDENRNLNPFSIGTNKTLPRNSSKIRPTKISLTIQDIEITVPLQRAPRPMTLPTRGGNKINNNHHNFDTTKNLLKFSRDKNIINQRLDNNNCADNNELINRKSMLKNDNCNNAVSSTIDNKNDCPCESPSYLTNSSYAFPSLANTKINCTDDSTTNPIPLPPRDRNKPILKNAKRHVRKHPLVIPGSNLKSTSNQINESPATVNIKQQIPFDIKQANINQINDLANNQVINNNEENQLIKATSKVYKNCEKEDNFDRDEILNDSYRTYENINVFDVNLNENCNTDSASLHFESILEDSFTNSDIISSPDVVDAFCPLYIQKEQYNKTKEINFNKSKSYDFYVNEDELRNLDTNKNKIEFLQIKQKSMLHDKENSNLLKRSKNNINELLDDNSESIDDHVNKNEDSFIKPTCTESQESPPPILEESNEEDQQKFEENRLQNNYSVSCEDLLEFADKKPKGCERGIDSDEVRIMLKVLGKDFSSQRCLTTLEFIDWDVHKALKVIRLQNIMDSVDLSLKESVEALQKYEWDIETTALKLKGLKLRNQNK